MRELRLAGYEMPSEEQAVSTGESSPGNDAWQRAKRLALEYNARERRN